MWQKKKDVMHRNSTSELSECDGIEKSANVKI